MLNLYEQLKDKKSVKRRSAAKKLRKLADVNAGQFLLEALKEEIKDTRTWETQYQIIMAIGECDFKEALPFLLNLSTKNFEATMVYVAIGDAIVRLSKQHENDALPALSLFKSDNHMLVDGALRAVAMLRMKPSKEQISQILKFVSASEVDAEIRFWVIAAAAGWTGKEVQMFLKQCNTSTREDFTEAVELALQQKYKKWFPL